MTAIRSGPFSLLPKPFVHISERKISTIFTILVDNTVAGLLQERPFFQGCFYWKNKITLKTFSIVEVAYVIKSFKNNRRDLKNMIKLRREIKMNTVFLPHLL
jgi:uncharacterized protein involved in tolerance to divalent cations